MDLNNPAEIEKEFNRIKDQYGSLDILVNNAGISQRESIYDLKPEDFDNIIELNVNAMFYCSQAAAKSMKP